MHLRFPSFVIQPHPILNPCYNYFVMRLLELFFLLVANYELVVFPLIFLVSE